jgi:hypothetical protein
MRAISQNISSEQVAITELTKANLEEDYELII